MPTYQYACTACGHQFEAVQSFSEASLTQCPECAGRLRKLYGAVGVVFKGSGFYRTDSRTGGGNGKEPAPGSAKEPAPGGKAEKAGDSAGGATTSAAGAGTAPAKTSKTSTATKSTSGAPTS